MIAIFLINGYLQEKGLDACVGINALSALTSGFLGLPGVALLYGVRVYLMG
ncbi:MAG: pro-sigmaK processing inhibitor BofA family protein [Gallintestinimicrobium sp.]